VLLFCNRKITRHVSHVTWYPAASYSAQKTKTSHFLAGFEVEEAVMAEEEFDIEAYLNAQSKVRVC
jgi:hypothetical protein